MQTLEPAAKNGHLNDAAPISATEAGHALPSAINPEAVPAVGGAHRTGDRITRRRDVHGNRHPWFYSHSVPGIEDVPLKETALAEAIEAIREQLPITASELEHHYDHKLRPTLRRHIATRDAEEAQLRTRNETVREQGQQLDAQIEQVNRTDQKAYAEAERRLGEAHLEAARKVAEVGGAYDPQNPDPQEALRVVRMEEAVLAAPLCLPWTPADKAVTLHPILGGLITLVIGMAIGLSMGIMSGFVPVGNWFSRPVAFAFFQAFGIAVALVSKYAIRLSAREASQRYWLGRAALQWGFFGAVSVLVSITLFVIDSFVEREGIMANVRMQDLARSLSGQLPAGEMGSKEWLYFLMAIILTFAYVVNAYWEGYLSGRYDACLNRIRAEQERIYREEDVARRALPGVQIALEAIAGVRKMQLEMGMLQARIAERTAPLEARRRVEQEELSEEADRRIQDALDQFNGTQTDFNTMFAEAKIGCEGGGNLLQRANRILVGAPKRRQRQRDQKRRIK